MDWEEEWVKGHGTSESDALSSTLSTAKSLFVHMTRVTSSDHSVDIYEVLRNSRSLSATWGAYEVAFVFLCRSMLRVTCRLISFER